MIQVRKRDGRLQEFKPEKIQVSILNAARDLGLTLSDKETSLIAKDVEEAIKVLGGQDMVVSSEQIRAMVGEEIERFGFKELADLFQRGKSQDETDIARHKEAIAYHQKCLEALEKKQ